MRPRRGPQGTHEPRAHRVLVTVDTIRESFGVSRATAFRRMALLRDEVRRGVHPGAELVALPVTRGNGAAGIEQAVRFADDEREERAA